MKIISLFSLLIIFITPFPLKAGDKPTVKTDTLAPFSILNNYFDKSSAHNVYNVSFESYIDSVICFTQLSDQESTLLTYVRNLYKYDTDDFQFLIDSILDQDSIPSELISAIDYCLNLIFNNDIVVACEPLKDAAAFSYPASGIYNDIWCQINPNPYPIEMIDSDSILEIGLISDTSKFSMPCSNAPVTSKYGWRDGRMHQGIDLGVDYSLPVYSTFDGVVRYAKFFQGYGRLVIVRHYNGLETYYAHLSRIIVKPGQFIKAGETIGRAGNSGKSSGTHLHYEIRYKGVPLNPAHLVSFKENKLSNDKIILKKIKRNFFVYSENAIIYSVQSGDFLYKIAKEYGITVQQLCDMNDLSKNTRLKVGQLIKICL